MIFNKKFSKYFKIEDYKKKKKKKIGKIMNNFYIRVFGYSI